MKKALVVSHERSGTHFLINTIAANFAPYAPDAISVQGADAIAPTAEQREAIRGELRQALDAYRGTFEPRVFKSHHQFEYFEPFVGEILDEYAVFYIVRDGRDVMTSMFHYFKNNAHLPHQPFPNPASVAELVRLVPADYPFDGPLSYRPAADFAQRWAWHVEGWTSRADSVTVVRYEDLKGDVAGAVGRIAEALDLDAPASPVLPGFDMPTVNARKGIVGDWQGHFDPDSLALFEEHAGDIMRELGYDQ